MSQVNEIFEGMMSGTMIAHIDGTGAVDREVGVSSDVRGSLSRC